MNQIAFESHDHTHCIADGLAQAKAYCARNGLKLTSQRERVLTILLRKHSAVGAYDILDELKQDGISAQPPTVYRALDFLVSNGFAHKVERLNAFIACSHTDPEHTPVFLICQDCNRVAELPQDTTEALTKTAEDGGFTIERIAIEAVGQCADCKGAA